MPDPVKAPAASTSAPAPAVTTVASQVPAKKPAAPAKPKVKIEPNAPATKTVTFKAATTEKPKNLLAEAAAAAELPKKSLTEKIAERAAAYEEKQKAKKSSITNPDDNRSPAEIQAEAQRTAPPAAEEEVIDDPAAAPTTLAEQMAAEGLAPLDAPAAVEVDPNAAPVATEVAAAADWQPDFKIKTLKFERPDDPKAVEVESEIPEEFRPLMKDEESAKRIREIFQKSQSFDFVKETKARVQAQRDQGADYLNQIGTRLSTLDQQIAAGEMETVFKTMGISKEKVLQYVLDDITYQQLEPGQKQLIDAQRASESRAKSLEQQNQQLAQGRMKAMISAKNMELDAILARPDVSQVMMAYDSRKDKPPGAPSFRDLVINQGEIAWHRSGGKIDLASSEAVETVLRDYGLRQAYGPAATPATAPAQVAQPAVAAPLAPGQRPATRAAAALPNVQGRAASPTTPKIKTRADLEARIKQVTGKS